jgi:transcriptional regulator with XRE-family HTH domain
MQQMISKERLKLNISENLSRLMHARGLSQSELGRISETSQVLVYRLLNQVLVPNAQDLANIAEALSVTIDDLISNPPENPAQSKINKKVIQSA